MLFPQFSIFSNSVFQNLSELGTCVLDTYNPDPQILISTEDTFNLRINVYLFITRIKIKLICRSRSSINRDIQRTRVFNFLSTHAYCGEIRIWVLQKKLNFLTPTSLKHKSEHLRYFKLRLLALSEFIVWNI